MATIEITTMTGCPLMCTFCPQDALKEAYGKVSDKYMSLATFQTLLDKIPQHVRIDFSGMAEPWANPLATQMLEMALKQGRQVAVYTTLYGITVEDSVRITQEILPSYEEQIAVVCLHLPDDNMNMKGYKGSDEYREVLKNFLKMAEINPKLGGKFQKMTMDKGGRVHRDLQDLVPGLGDWNGHSRAGSLSEEAVEQTGAKQRPHNEFSLVCASTPYYDHNVVLPNGDVVLCCMDYALKHIIGNLLTSDYWDLFVSQELGRLRIENQKPEFSKCSICKECENVIEFKSDKDGMWVHGLPTPTSPPVPSAVAEVGLRDVLRYFKRKAIAVVRG